MSQFLRTGLLALGLACVPTQMASAGNFNFGIGFNIDAQWSGSGHRPLCHRRTCFSNTYSFYPSHVQAPSATDPSAQLVPQTPGNQPAPKGTAVEAPVQYYSYPPPPYSVYQPASYVPPGPYYYQPAMRFDR